MRWQDFIATARLLTTTPHTNAQPLQDSLRRAVSTAYYAMFHALASRNADCLVGTPHDSLTEHAWARIYRGLNHSTARRNLLQDRVCFLRKLGSSRGDSRNFKTSDTRRTTTPTNRSLFLKPSLG